MNRTFIGSERQKNAQGCVGRGDRPVVIARFKVRIDELLQMFERLIPFEWCRVNRVDQNQNFAPKLRAVLRSGGSVVDSVEIRDWLWGSIVKDFEGISGEAADRIAVVVRDSDVDIRDGDLNSFDKRRLLREREAEYEETNDCKRISPAGVGAFRCQRFFELVTDRHRRMTQAEGPTHKVVML